MIVYLNMILYVIATPLGNLQDISNRALETLKQADYIIAEDTRRTAKLLNFYQIHVKIKSCHVYSTNEQIQEIIDLLNQGSKIALVTDAGTPLISDPGARLIDQIYNTNPAVKIIPIPGPSAVTTALCVSGFPADQFHFWGFPPKKGLKRGDFFKKIADHPDTQVFFSTPHAILKDLNQLKQCINDQRLIFIGREMTKIFESYYRGPIEAVIDLVTKNPQKGEYTIAISKST